MRWPTFCRQTGIQPPSEQCAAGLPLCRMGGKNTKKSNDGVSEQFAVTFLFMLVGSQKVGSKQFHHKQKSRIDTRRNNGQQHHQYSTPQGRHFIFFLFSIFTTHFSISLSLSVPNADALMKDTHYKKTTFDVIQRDSFPSAANEFPSSARSLTSPL